MDQIDVSKITNVKTYEPPKGYVIIYIHECFNPDTNEVRPYSGRTDTSIRKRAGKNFKNYHGTATNKGETKFEEYLNLYGCRYITSRIYKVVPEELGAITEQEAIDVMNSISLGYNTYNAIIERKTANTRKYLNKANEKNKPTIQGFEDVSLTFLHRDGSVDTATINAGLYNAKYKNTVLYLDHPGIDGTVTLKDITRKHTTVLQELSKDLSIGLKFGPAGRHTITLDNIYIVGTKTSLRIFLAENPEYLQRVAYLIIGKFDEE